MSYKRVLTIQDISCVGQCSMSVVLPILSACGHETCILPSAILSTHTGGFKNVVKRDLTEDMPGIVEHWQREGIDFDAVYSGYLGSIDQINIVKDAMKNCLRKQGVCVVDPAMADNGKLYHGFDAAFVEEMKGLVFSADFCLPNLTEAALLTGSDYQEEYDEAYTDTLIEKMVQQGAKNIVITGVSYQKETTGVLIYEQGKKYYYQHKRFPKGCHGTGDEFAAAFVGALLQGKDTFSSVKIAADFVVQCIENTIDDSSHWYGAKFETALPYLIDSLRK